MASTTHPPEFFEVIAELCGDRSLDRDVAPGQSWSQTLNSEKTRSGLTCGVIAKLNSASRV